MSEVKSTIHILLITFFIVLLISGYLFYKNFMWQEHDYQRDVLLEANMPRATFGQVFLYLYKNNEFKISFTDMLAGQEEFFGKYTIKNNELNLKEIQPKYDDIPHKFYIKENWIFFYNDQSLNDTISCRDCFRIYKNKYNVNLKN